MATHTTVETARDRRSLVRDAGMPRVSFVSILAGTLVAFGAVTLLAAAAGAVGSEMGLTTDGISNEEWRQAGIGATVAGALVLFASFFFGGYTAGRMGRRAGTTHGLGVFVLAALLIGIVAALAAWLGDTDAVTDTLNDNGVPTDGDTWSDIGIGAAIAAGVAMLLGSVLGGMKGDRWHTRLTRAAVDSHETRRDAAERTEDEPDRVLGEDPTTVDLRDDDPDRELSVEEERERARTTS